MFTTEDRVKAYNALKNSDRWLTNREVAAVAKSFHLAYEWKVAVNQGQRIAEGSRSSKVPCADRADS